jgi:toxin ParE1/3/4
MTPRLSAKALADLDSIWAYSQTQWGDGQAESYLRRIQQAIALVASDLRRARPCDELRPGYRRIAAGSHVIFCRQMGETLEVIRILHQRMDFDRHL